MERYSAAFRLWLIYRGASAGRLTARLFPLSLTFPSMIKSLILFLVAGIGLSISIAFAPLGAPIGSFVLIGASHVLH